MRILAGVFAICTIAACSFDTTGAPSGSPDNVDASTLVAPPDAGVADAAPPQSPPDACMGKHCDGDTGPGGH
jgi:hypothetical protein